MWGYCIGGEIIDTILTLPEMLQLPLFGTLSPFSGLPILFCALDVDNFENYNHGDLLSVSLFKPFGCLQIHNVSNFWVESGAIASFCIVLFNNS